MSWVPKGWAEASLGKFGDVFCGQSSTASDVNSEGRGTPYVTGPEQWTGSALHLNKWTTTPKRVVPDGCIFITVKGAGVGKMFPGVHCAIGRDIYAYQPSQEVSYAFVAKALTHTVNSVIREARGDIPGLSREHIADHSVPLPPLAEQKRIVAKLDALSANSARARTELARIETLVSRYKQAVLRKAFSGELTAEWQSSSPMIKQGWLQKLLEQIVVDGPSNGWSPIAGGAPSGLKSLRLSATSSGKLVLDDATIKYIDVELSEASKYWLCPDDILIQRANSLELLGTTVLFDGPPRQFIYPDLMMRVRVDPAVVTPSFLATYLNTETARTYFREKATGTAGNMPKINGRTVRAIPVPVPPLSEQHEIVRRIETAFARIDCLAAEAKRALTLVGKLDEAILAKAFRGELVPQDERDEPASVLLDRIRAERAAAPKPKRARARAQGNIA